jgi:hypothetical protein
MSSSTSRPEWRIGDKAIQFEKIILVALYSLGSDVWQADIAVDF